MPGVVVGSNGRAAVHGEEQPCPDDHVARVGIDGTRRPIADIDELEPGRVGADVIPAVGHACVVVASGQRDQPVSEPPRRPLGAIDALREGALRERVELCLARRQVDLGDVLARVEHVAAPV